ncbi:probable mitochondrial import inner membrane translocase subunit tim-13 [Ramularia collo-cygni]|uniref:Mitochondrial import inner membrane translocase subunit n=1 Tax=Ramularia collo-cygni TaxID=112498 RepID=A0A2D3VPB6_9PEZI|nr:probable mitochondrial import inner membrane translocase subunit tim-13 [Ramularia collo-cygni]CZT24914.1 probable mitochondrial import inner membrane translocase subunit tim-13 [Ramularia collo-cygni]
MSDAKQQIMDQVRQQAALQNARALVEKVNEHCFERCVPKPGSSLSSGETTCYTACMEKYMKSWNIISQQYLNHVQKGVGNQGAFGA